MQIVRSLFLFALAGLCEIGGGYLVWLWLRGGKSPWFALAGAVVLVLYGVIPTLQPAHFGRVYAAYGGIFIVLSLLRGAGAGRGAGHHVLAARVSSATRDHNRRSRSCQRGLPSPGLLLLG